MKFFVAFASDGTVFKRSSEGRTYSHCVAVYRSNVAFERFGTHYPASAGWVRHGKHPHGQWASRLDLAQKVAASEKSWNTAVSNSNVERAEILEALEVDAATFRWIKGETVSAEDRRVVEIKAGKVKEGPEELAHLLPRLG